MLSILLKILSMIGITILVILGVLLVLILVVLFIPITYKVCGQIDEKIKEANVKIKWLFGIICFTLRYSDKLDYHLKVFGVDLTGLLKKKSASGEPTDTSDKISKNEIDDHLAEKLSENISSENTTFESQIPEDKQSEKPFPDEMIYETEEAKTKPTFFEKAQHIVQKIKSVFEKIKGILENISYYYHFLKEDDTQQFITHCFNVLFGILKSIRPKKLRLDAEFGFDSPDKTGKLYGYLCMLYPFYGDNIHIIPDFEKKVMKGTLSARGRLFICIIVYNALRILFDKKLYKVIHNLKRGGKQNGR